MTHNREDRVDALFEQAMGLPEAQREAFLRRECAGDQPLLEILRRLLAEDESVPTAFLGGDIAHRPAGFERFESAGGDDAIPKFIGSYRILSEIGRGGMGEVFEAEQESPHRRVALKVIRGGQLSRNLIQRFEREAYVLGQLQHPGIAHIYESGAVQIDGRRQPFFAMELIDGEPINTHAKKQDLNVHQRLELMARVCDAVQHAHQKAIIHRDLKPANILVVEHGTTTGTAGGSSGSGTTIDMIGQPKILDFGVARITDGDIQAVTLQTEVGQIVGTLAYMSPEQVAGDSSKLDTRCDVYAIGVVLFELLTGRLPLDIQGKSVAEAARMIRDEDPAPAGTLDRDLRGDVETIIAKAMEKDPERRYASAAEFAADIRRHLQDEPIAARQASAIYQLRKFARRNKGLVGGLALTLIVLVGGLVSTGYYLIEARAQRDDAIAARAEADAEAARADKEKAVAQAVNDFLTKDLLAAVAPSSESGQGKDVLMRDVLDEAAERIEEASRVGGRFEDMPLVEASIRETLGLTYRLLGEYGAAEPHLERARLLRRRELGEEHASTLNSVKNLAVLYHDLGRYDEAEPLYVKTLEIQKRVLGEEHPDTIGSTNNLANLYQEQGRYDEAEPLYVKTLEIRQRVLGEKHPDTLGSMANLAVLHWRQGRYDEAERLYVKTLEINKRVLGEEHPDTLGSMNNLAMLYKDQGRYDEAETLMVKTLEIQRRVLGDEHPSTLGSISNLGLLYLSMKRFDDARAMFESSLPIKRRLLGMQHPWTRFALEGLAEAYDGLDRGDDALPLWRELQEFQLAQAEDPDASTQVLNAAAWDLLTTEHAELRDPARALLLAQRAVDKPGGVNPGILDTLAKAWFDTGDVARAVKTQEKAVSLLPPGDSPLRTELEANLATYRAATTQPAAGE